MYRYCGSGVMENGASRRPKCEVYISGAGSLDLPAESRQAGRTIDRGEVSLVVLGGEGARDVELQEAELLALGAPQAVAIVHGKVHGLSGPQGLLLAVDDEADGAVEHDEHALGVRVVVLS